MVLPSSSNSKLAGLQNARNSASNTKQTGINDYLKKSQSIVPQQHQHHRSMHMKRYSHLPSSSTPSPSTPSSSTPAAAVAVPIERPKLKRPVLSDTLNTSAHVPSNKILSGVVACLDVRTEDGDDVSKNFERALQSMGAKTRRTFSDSVTHLIFKNGSPATLKKAMSKNVFIINLLWISRCKREGKRLPEKDFIIERPQGLVLAGKKRKRSMEPGKVKALVLSDMEPSLSSSSEGSFNNDEPKTEIRRQTIATGTWAARELKKPTNESLDRKRQIEELEAGNDGDVLPPPRLSLPISVESIASRHVTEKPVKETTIIPIHPPSTKKQEEIKARFSIGQARSSDAGKNNDTLQLLNPSRLSLSTPTATHMMTPIKRKRRLTGNLSRPSSANIDSLFVDGGKSTQ